MRTLLFLLLAAATLGAQTRPPRLTPENVGGLVQAWSYDTRESTEPAPSGAQAARLRGDAGVRRRPAVPVHAGRPRDRARCGNRRRGVAGRSQGPTATRTTATSPIAASSVAGDRIYAARRMRGSSASIAPTAASATGFGARGQVDLDRASGAKPNGRANTASPLRPWSIATSSSSARRSPTTAASACHRARCGPSTPVRRAALDVSSTARESPAGGANTWSRITVDEANGLVFLPTGSASPDYFGGPRHGDNGHANASSRCTPRPVRSRGRSRPFITISGTTMSPRRRCSSRERAAPRSRSDRRPGISFSSIG